MALVGAGAVAAAGDRHKRRVQVVANDVALKLVRDSPIEILKTCPHRQIATAISLTSFEGLVGTPEYPQNYPFGTGHCTTDSSGLTVGGVQFIGRSESFGLHETYIPGEDVGPDWPLDGSFVLVGGRTFTDIYFPSGITAFGFDFGLVYDSPFPQTLDVEIDFTDGTSHSATLPVPGQSQFFGWTGLEVERVRYGSVSEYAPIDNLSFGTTRSSSVPDSGPSFGLLSALFAAGVLAQTLRNRRDRMLLKSAARS